MIQRIHTFDRLRFACMSKQLVLFMSKAQLQSMIIYTENAYQEGHVRSLR